MRSPRRRALGSLANPEAVHIAAPRSPRGPSGLGAEASTADMAAPMSLKDPSGLVPDATTCI